MAKAPLWAVTDANSGKPGAGVEVARLHDEFDSGRRRELTARDRLVMGADYDRDPIECGQRGRALDRGLKKRLRAGKHGELLREIDSVQCPRE